MADRVHCRICGHPNELPACARCGDPHAQGPAEVVQGRTVPARVLDQGAVPCALADAVKAELAKVEG